METLALGLIDHVIENKVDLIEKCLKQGYPDCWRVVVRYELPITTLLSNDLFQQAEGGEKESTFQSNVLEQLAAKLLSYEIKSLSVIHVAALLGRTDCLITLLDKDIPVDSTVESGTTPLHLACFGGYLETVKILLTVYRAEKDTQDRYGWTALYYAATEGHLDIIKTLVEAEADIFIKDKDGTTAAYRAFFGGHPEVVSYLSKLGLDQDLLETIESQAKQSPINKTEQKEKLNSKKMTDNRVTRSQSLNVKPVTGSLAGRPLIHSQTLPRKLMRPLGTNNIRKVVREEIQKCWIDPESDYLEPIDVLEQRVADSEEGQINVKELKNIMRDELEKFRDEILNASQRSTKNNQLFNSNTGSGIHHQTTTGNNTSITEEDDPYKDLYETLNDVNLFPTLQRTLSRENRDTVFSNLPGPPPLPPRQSRSASLNSAGSANSQQSSNSYYRGTSSTRLSSSNNDQVHSNFDRFCLDLGSSASEELPNAALAEAFRRTIKGASKQWKQLAHVLPIASTTARVSERVMAIEMAIPSNHERQMEMTLNEWTHNAIPKADLDGLVLALRKLNLVDVADEVNNVASEFTA